MRTCSYIKVGLFSLKTILWLREFHGTFNQPVWSTFSGNRVDPPSAKPLKSSAKPERKALQDVSNIPKGSSALKNRSTVKERSTLKERSALRDVSNNNLKERSILKERPPLQDVSNTHNERSILKEKSTLHNPVNIFADDEETKRCHEWAKDGIEGTHFTGNDSQKLYKDLQDKRKSQSLTIALFVSLIRVWYIFIVASG